MRRFILGFLVATILILFAVWHFSRTDPHMAMVKKDLQNAATDTRDFVEEKTGLSDLTSDDIKSELLKTGRIVRRKAAEIGSAISDATADPRKVAVIKGKLLADQTLSSLDISVSCNHGEVTLSGTATSAENIRSAIEIAMSVDGVTRVISTLRVKEPKN